MFKIAGELTPAVSMSRPGRSRRCRRLGAPSAGRAFERTRPSARSLGDDLVTPKLPAQGSRPVTITARAWARSWWAEEAETVAASLGTDARAEARHRGGLAGPGRRRCDDRRRRERRARPAQGRYRGRNGDQRHRGRARGRRHGPRRRQLRHDRRGCARGSPHLRQHPALDPLRTDRRHRRGLAHVPRAARVCRSPCCRSRSYGSTS